MAAVLKTKANVAIQIAAGILLHGLWSEATKENAKALKDALQTFEKEQVHIHEPLKARVVAWISSCGDVAIDGEALAATDESEEE